MTHLSCVLERSSRQCARLPAAAGEGHPFELAPHKVLERQFRTFRSRLHSHTGEQPPHWQISAPRRDPPEKQHPAGFGSWRATADTARHALAVYLFRFPYPPSSTALFSHNLSSGELLLQTKSIG